MSLILGKPFWLSAYPNEGTLDYFGFRFYRQPLRSFLVRGAAANDFKNAKTLIFFGAITFAFRNQYKLEPNEELTEDLITKWKNWFQAANYLYVVGCYQKNKSVPDRGFTGAIEEAQKHLIPFFLSEKESFDIFSSKNVFYPPQREWGYLAQFWLPPLSYFRIILDISSCLSGEYAKDCFQLLSSYENWDLFINTIQSGIISKKGYQEISKILDCQELTPSEKALAKKIIFDGDGYTGKENDEYKKNYNFINDLIQRPFEGFQCKNKNEIAMILSYMHLKNIDFSEVDTQWKILVSSLMFEIGICRFYTLISSEISGDSISSSQIKEAIRKALKKNPCIESLDQPFSSVILKWKNLYLENIIVFNNQYNNFLDYDNLGVFIDGIIAGYLISQIQKDKEREDVYNVLTDNYHHFSPQVFFRTKKVDEERSINEFIEKTCLSILEEQYEFSMERMNFGQKAKFILIKSEFGDEYIYQIDKRGFYENRGIIEMIEACLTLWKSAGL